MRFTMTTCFVGAIGLVLSIYLTLFGVVPSEIGTYFIVLFFLFNLIVVPIIALIMLREKEEAKKPYFKKILLRVAAVLIFNPATFIFGLIVFFAWDQINSINDLIPFAIVSLIFGIPMMAGGGGSGGSDDYRDSPSTEPSKSYFEEYPSPEPAQYAPDGTRIN